MKEISFGNMQFIEGWKVYRKDNGKYYGVYEVKTPLSRTEDYDDRFKLRKYIMERGDKQVHEYLVQLDLRFKSIYLPVLTIQLMSFYSSDVENIKFMKHQSKRYQNLLKRSMKNYLTIVDAECKTFGVYEMVDFLSDKFNDHVFCITEKAINAIRERLIKEDNRDDICKTIMVNILAQTISCRNDIFKLKNEKSLRDIIWATDRLMVEMFSGAYVVDLNKMDVYPIVSELIKAMNNFDLSGYIREYKQNKRNNIKN